MSGRPTLFASFVLLALVAPLAASSIAPESNERGGYDADGEWVASVESEIHASWWLHWSRDKDANSLDDRLEWLLEQPNEVQQDWWRRAPPGSARVFVDYDHHPSDADVWVLEELGAEVTFRAKYLDTVAATVPFELLLDPEGVRALPGVVMVEDLGLAEPDMHEAVPTMGVDDVWMDLGLDGTGSVIAVLDTGIKGDHEGLNDMDDDPFTCLDDPPDPLDPNPEPIPRDCDPKIIAFYDAVFTDEEQDPSTSYDSGTHGSHVAGIAAGTGGGQTDPETGLRYVGAAPGAYLINILACCDGDIEDIIQGAQWAIENRDKYGIDIVTSSLGEQQFEIHVDNDGNSAWSRQMDMVVEAGITTTLSAGNELGGVTFVGCNTIDSPGDARLPITVASLDKDLSLAIYSSRGYTSDLRVKPDVATIGSNIMAPDAATQDGYISKSGTSMATPLMAGIAALMIQANPDLTPSELKAIVSDQSIEREVSLFGDAGLNDCSLLETRPDNEFGYGQADPVAFVEAAGSIDRSLNVSMDIHSMDEVLNQSYLSGTASGTMLGQGEVQVRVGGGDWKGAADVSKDGDWAQWSVKLDPHIESGNSTIYARLVADEDHISPVDARRVILIDVMASGGISDGSNSFGPRVFFIPFFLVLGILGLTMTRERWDRRFSAGLNTTDDNSGETEDISDQAEWEITGRPENRLGKLLTSWNDGTTLVENQFRRYVSLSILYTAQGLPWGFTSVAFAAFLVDNGATPAEIGTLFATIALPWTFKFIWGPMIDVIQVPRFGRRRPWVLFAQTGMVITLGALLLVSDLNASIGLVTTMLFVHNLFASLQDVSVDALAVDVLQPDEVGKANGFMFAAKRGGIIIGGAVLGMLVVPFGIKAAITVQIPLLLLIMMLPLFLRERPGDQLFPWSKQEDKWWTEEDVSKEAPTDYEVESIWVKLGHIKKAFSLRSTILLVFLCLLAELYVFVDPIIIDIFINEAGWSQPKYNGIVGGVVILFLMLGQIIGGFLGDKFGTREVAMLGFTMLALANAGLAMLSDYWTNTTVMVTYLSIRAIVNGIAWISVISVCMRLTYSKAGGSQFTAYMSMFNLSGVMAYQFTAYMVVRFDYVTALYIGGALTMLTVVLLVFIDPDETDRVLEGRLGDDEFDGDFGERPKTWVEDGGGEPVAAA
jgi:PAT family beta-lactamase induction signal transducer AmpG